MSSATGKRLRVLVVDDHEVVHWGLKTLVSQQQWVQRYLTARDADEALALVRRYEPHVAVVDVGLGGDSGTDLCERIRAVSPVTRVLLMSGQHRMSARAARAAGASGFVSKLWGGGDLAGAIRMVGLGVEVFTPDEQQPAPLLSKRETEVLGLLADGATNREISERLFLSPHTVKEHTSALYRKMKARNRADAVRRAERMGLLA